MHSRSTPAALPSSGALAMNWFDRLMRNAGLMIHHAIKPLRKSEKQVVKKTVEEEKLNETMTLRRTTIEEIEIRRDDK
jgi:hypothetical protein